MLTVNLSGCVRWAKYIGCDEDLLCDVSDLVDREDLARALSSIHAIARRTAELGIPYPACVKLEVKL